MRILRRGFKSMLNAALAPLGIKVSRTSGHDWNDVANFIPFSKTMDAAEAAGMTVGDYVDAVRNGIPGASKQTIEKVASLGVFSGEAPSIVEIGPGTGRYLERTLNVCKPSRYEIYETAGPWADYIRDNYPVVVQPTDGYSLSATGTDGVDVVQAHKVFSTVPFIVTCCYLHEIARVVRPGGWAVFDVVSEHCLGGDAMQLWANSGIRNGSYPAIFPREVLLKFFLDRGFTQKGSWLAPMPPGVTEVFVFGR